MASNPSLRYTQCLARLWSPVKSNALSSSDRLVFDAVLVAEFKISCERDQPAVSANEMQITPRKKLIHYGCRITRLFNSSEGIRQIPNLGIHLLEQLVEHNNPQLKRIVNHLFPGVMTGLPLETLHKRMRSPETNQRHRIRVRGGGPAIGRWGPFGRHGTPAHIKGATQP